MPRTISSRAPTVPRAAGVENNQAFEASKACRSSATGERDAAFSAEGSKSKACEMSNSPPMGPAMLLMCSISRAKVGSRIHHIDRRAVKNSCQASGVSRAAFASSVSMLVRATLNGSSRSASILTPVGRCTSPGQTSFSTPICGRSCSLTAMVLSLAAMWWRACSMAVVMRKETTAPMKSKSNARAETNLSIFNRSASEIMAEVKEDTVMLVMSFSRSNLAASERMKVFKCALSTSGQKGKKTSMPKALEVAKALNSGVHLLQSSCSPSARSTKAHLRKMDAVALYLLQKMSKP
mmetsp:Transcript_127268/g.366037  ORF Transcript_127268/g.366037 Transcript_127268/m.366037 type:complete len:294 (+) Transcript_127268:573-1454(+)